MTLAIQNDVIKTKHKKTVAFFHTMNRKNLLLLVIFVITFVLVLISQNILYKLSVSNYSRRKIVLQSSGKQRKLMNKGKF